MHTIPYARAVSHFHSKDFEGTKYTFGHLDPFRIQVPMDAAGTKHIDMHVTFGCHCFTEEFKSPPHLDHHRYTFQEETRAFDVQRYECSLQLPDIITKMLKGKIYRADGSYTYVAHITLSDAPGAQAYSVFFNLVRDKSRPGHALKMFVKSGYLKQLVTMTNAQNWRFVGLAGDLTDFFPKVKKERPRKKAP
jgi:hypothetical protein